MTDDRSHPPTLEQTAVRDFCVRHGVDVRGVEEDPHEMLRRLESVRIFAPVNIFPPEPAGGPSFEVGDFVETKAVRDIAHYPIAGPGPYPITAVYELACEIRDADNCLRILLNWEMQQAKQKRDTRLETMANEIIDSVDDMTDEEVDAELRERGLDGVPQPERWRAEVGDWIVPLVEYCSNGRPIGEEGPFVVLQEERFLVFEDEDGIRSRIFHDECRLARPDEIPAATGPQPERRSLRVGDWVVNLMPNGPAVWGMASGVAYQIREIDSDGDGVVSVPDKSDPFFCEPLEEGASWRYATDAEIQAALGEQQTDEPTQPERWRRVTPEDAPLPAGTRVRRPGAPETEGRVVGAYEYERYGGIRVEMDNGQGWGANALDVQNDVEMFDDGGSNG